MDNSDMALSPCLTDETDGSQPIDFLQLSNSFGIGTSIHSENGGRSFDDDTPLITFNPSLSVEVTLGKPSSLAKPTATLTSSIKKATSQHSGTCKSETPTQDTASSPITSDEVKVPPSILEIAHL